MTPVQATSPEAPIAPAECDLVMKGGITSGIVYPPAVYELQQHYRFRNIGGTSAGAIAAACTAAAEVNRANGGFDTLLKVSKELSDTKDKHGAQNDNGISNLQKLFQASPTTQPLLDILNAVLKPPAKAAPAQDAPTQDASAPTSELDNLPLFLNLLKRVVPANRQIALVVANRLNIFWSKQDLTPYAPYLNGGAIGRGIGIALGIILAATLALAVTGAMSFSMSTQTLTGLILLLSVFGIACAVFGTLGGWLGLWLGRIIGVIWDTYDLLIRRVRGNFYGVCSGHTEVANPDGTNLTDWLSDTLDSIAGRAKRSNPLTFNDLKNAGVALNMVTSNLSHNRPYLLPYGLKNFLFREDEMRKLFPTFIVDFMIAHQPDTPDRKKLVGALPNMPAGQKFYFFPDLTYLPVVVCTRMSLSFPLLLSAIPLYSIKAQAYSDWLSGAKQTFVYLDDQKAPQNDMQRNWFSDGGICSNFPIQFFDAWLPSRPTFGINLTGKASDTSASTLSDLTGIPPIQPTTANTAANTDVFLFRAEDQQDPEWNNVEEPAAFAMSIFSTAQNYHDTMQACLPSYRERIAQIRLDDHEGGLNLTMPPEVINTVVQKGTEAGKAFALPDAQHPVTFHFEHHRWVRFRVLMAQLERNLEHVQAFFDGVATTTAPDTTNTTQSVQLPTPLPVLSFKELVQKQQQEQYPYWRDTDWCTEAQFRVQGLQTLIDTWNKDGLKRWGKPNFFTENAPTPNPVLRVTPEV